ncbi:helix-turn-helix domain-containing protein [Desulfovibrio sp. ZJ200]|uniref:helix-turn-helix domain-containing protein n=1 Tax=Desulfovibrio sp. ZJ200 TaxID=2709792 RepID=UPI001F151847|nr:helix-turn-helix domain-containing protein [Desulfovibrio sp. ZJ200]
MTGETPGARLRCLRLETAANMLRYSPGQTVTAIAHACVFFSSQNFARMFREWMGESPGRFRAACGQGKPPAPRAQNRKQPFVRPLCWSMLPMLRAMPSASQWQPMPPCRRKKVQ